MKNGEEKREFTRVPIKVDLEVQAEGYPPMTGRSADISLKGVSLECEQPLPVGTECQVTFLLGPVSNPVRVEVFGNVTRSSDRNLSIDVSSVIGIESFAHLKTLLAQNCEEEDLLEGEIARHIGLKNPDNRD